MQKAVSILLLLAIVGSNVAQISADKLQVTVYYSHLCGDSVRWVTNQLAPHWEAVRDYVDIEFIPFGKARSINGGESFECQFGPVECEGHIIQSCILHQLPEQDRQVSYVSCQMNFNADPRGWECAFRAGINLIAADVCVSGTQGIQLQLEAERRTQQIPLTFVPTITFNGVFDQEKTDLAFRDFKAAVCQMTNNAPAVC